MLPRAISILLASAGLFLPAFGQTASPTCGITAVPPLVRAEGVAERLGDIVLNCSGTPGREIAGNLTVSLSTNVTNKITSADNLDAILTIDYGAGPVLAGAPARLLGANQVVFAGLRFNLGIGGGAELRISNLRADASRLAQVSGSLQALVGFNPPDLLRFTTNNVTVGVPGRGLLATNTATSVASQVGSPIPETIGFSELIAAGTRFSSARITEGYSGAFEKRGPMMDNGVRILFRYRGYPSDARLFVPNRIAGSNATRPTVAGDFGGIVSGGEHTALSGTLLLVRIVNTDANGAGGYPVPSPPVPVGQVFNEVSEVQLSGGTGVAVYEVYDSNPSAIESAQIPTFIGLPRSVEARSITTLRDTFLAPISTTATVSSLAPVPRFVATAAPSDCTISRDCSQYIPKLESFPQNLDFVATSPAASQSRWILFENVGGGFMDWVARVEYKTGAGWVRISPESGVQGRNVLVAVFAIGLTPGRTYEATLVIDAGSAGIARFPIKLQVNEPLPPPSPVPTISSVSNAATFRADPLVAGSLATVQGTNLAGRDTSVTFNGTAARVLYTSDNQINLQVPVDISAAATAQVVVTINNMRSQAATVDLAPVSPGIFVPGIVNQDNTVNTAANPARTGSFVQIFATGLLPPDASGMIEARLHDQVYASLPYAGPAPGIPGVQQVNLQIPEGWPTMTTEVLLCATSAGIRACSPPVKISIRQ